MNTRHPAHGFTLLETILAVGLSALLIGLLGAGMRIYTSTVAQRRADVVNAQIARVILQQIAADLRAAYVAAEEPSSSSPTDATVDDETLDSGTGTATTTDDASVSGATADLATGSVQPEPGLFGNQTQLQVDVIGRFTEPIKFDTLTAAGVDPLAANLLSDPKVITYFLRSFDSSELAGTPLQSMGTSGSQTVLVRQVTNRAEASFAAVYGAVGSQAGQQLLSDQVVMLQFKYHDGFDWVDSWDSSLTGGLPMAVNISIALLDENATDAADGSTLSAENLFEQTVYLPAAALPDTSTTGI